MEMFIFIDTKYFINLKVSPLKMKLVFFVCE